MEVFGAIFFGNSDKVVLKKRLERRFLHRVNNVGSTTRSVIGFPESQLILGFNTDRDVIISTFGLFCCNAVGVGFRNCTNSSGLYLSHSVPGLERSTISSLTHAITIAEEWGYYPVFGEIVTNSDPDDKEYTNNLNDGIVTLLGEFGVKPLVDTYSGAIDYQIAHNSGKFVTLKTEIYD